MCLERVVPFAFDILFFEWSLFADLTVTFRAAFSRYKYSSSSSSESPCLLGSGSGSGSGSGCARTPLHRRESDLSFEIPSCTLDPPILSSDLQ